MDRQYIIEQNIVDQYLMGQLSPSDVDRFEAYYLSCKETLEELETTEKLIKGFAKNTLAEASRGRAKSQALMAAAPVARPSRNWAAMAASLLAAAAIAFGAYTQSQLSDVRQMVASADINFPIISLGATRSVYSARTIEIPAKPVRIAFALDIGFPQSDNYEVVLKDAEGLVVWSATALHPDTLDSLTFSLPAGTLSAGKYEFIAAPVDNKEDPVRIGLVVEYKP